MICSKCKNEIPDNSKFCSFCGANVAKKPIFARNRITFKTRIKLTFFLVLFSFFVGVAIFLKGNAQKHTFRTEEPKPQYIPEERKVLPVNQEPEKEEPKKEDELTLEDMLRYYESF